MAESKPRWEIRLTRQAEKTLYHLSKPLLQRMDQTLLALAKNPRPPESRRLAGPDNLYRLPLDDWRIAYTVEDERRVVLILEIAPRQQPERYRLDEESGQSLPPERLQQTQTTEPLITFLHSQNPGEFGVQFGTIGDLIRFRGPSLLKRIEQEKIRLLIVDNMPETRENLRKLLFIEADVEVVGEAASGEAAVQLAIKLQPDVVLMDMLMPGMEGLAAAEAISQQLPSIQIIMMSVYGEADYLRRAMLAGAKEFLIKPFSGDELLTSIRRVYRTAAFQKTRLPLAPRSRDAFNDLKERMLNQLVTELDPAVDMSRPDEARRAIGDLFERILGQENIILSRSERERLFESLVDELELRRTTGDTLTAPAEGRRWYMIYGHAGYEYKVRENLLQRVAALGLQDRIFQVIVPGDRAKARVSPGAVLVEMILDEDSWYVIGNTPGVTGYFGSGEKPTPLPVAEVDNLLKYGETDEPETNGSFKVGQKVRIVEGPFADFTGIVDAVDQDQARVKVQLSFFGGKKWIEFDFLQVERA